MSRSVFFRLAVQTNVVDSVEIESLLRFAELVAASERQACAAVCREDWVEVRGWDMATADAIYKAIQAKGKQE
jgi:hypothetical protein